MEETRNACRIFVEHGHLIDLEGDGNIIIIIISLRMQVGWEDWDSNSILVEYEQIICLSVNTTTLTCLNYSVILRHYSMIQRFYLLHIIMLTHVQSYWKMVHCYSFCHMLIFCYIYKYTTLLQLKLPTDAITHLYPFHISLLFENIEIINVP